MAKNYTITLDDQLVADLEYAILNKDKQVGYPPMGFPNVSTVDEWIMLQINNAFYSVPFRVAELKKQDMIEAVYADTTLKASVEAKVEEIKAIKLAAIEDAKGALEAPAEIPAETP